VRKPSLCSYSVRKGSTLSACSRRACCTYNQYGGELVQQKALCVTRLADSQSIAALQRDDPPVGQAIRGSIKQFKDSGGVQKRKAPRRPCTSEKNVQRVRLSCQFRQRNSYLPVGVCTWAYLKRRFETSCTRC